MVVKVGSTLAEGLVLTTAREEEEALGFGGLNSREEEGSEK